MNQFLFKSAVFLTLVIPFSIQASGTQELPTETAQLVIESRTSSTSILKSGFLYPKNTLGDFLLVIFVPGSGSIEVRVLNNAIARDVHLDLSNYPGWSNVITTPCPLVFPTNPCRINVNIPSFPLPTTITNVPVYGTNTNTRFVDISAF